MTAQPPSMPVVDINSVDLKLTINECMKIISEGLDKGARNGAFTLDESFTLKVALSNITKILDLLTKKKETA